MSSGLPSAKWRQACDAMAAASGLDWIRAGASDATERDALIHTAWDYVSTSARACE